MKPVLALVAAAVLFVGCAANPPLPPLAPGAGPLQQAQYYIQQLFGGTIQAVMADANARLLTIDALVANGTLSPAQAAQKKQCASNVLSLVGGIQQQIGMKIPDGAGLIWLMGLVNDMNGPQVDLLNTQLKLTFDTCKDQLQLHGLKF